MNLKPIIQKRHSPRAAITVNFTKSGLLSFSKGASDHIPELAKAKKVLIMQDQERPNDFYLHLIQDPTKADEMYPSIRKNTHNRIIANYRCAYEAIIEQYKTDHKAIRLPIGGRVNVAGDSFYILITHVLKKEKG